MVNLCYFRFDLEKVKSFAQRHKLKTGFPSEGGLGSDWGDYLRYAAYSLFKVVSADPLKDATEDVLASSLIDFESSSIGFRKELNKSKTEFKSDEEASAVYKAFNDRLEDLKKGGKTGLRVQP